MRKAEKKRISQETKINCSVAIDSLNPKSKIEVPIGFLRHMIELFSKFSRLELLIDAEGDLDVDIHHLNEDLAIVLGQCLDEALADRCGIRRVGWAYVPMDEALARVVIDLNGRPYLSFNVFVIRVENQIPEYSIEYARQFFTAVANHLRATIHIDLLRGVDFHHCLEAIFKAFGLAFRDAVEVVDRDLPSTKGIID